MRIMKWFWYRWKDRDDWKSRAMLMGYQDGWDDEYPVCDDEWPGRNYQLCWDAWLMARKDRRKGRESFRSVLEWHLSKEWRHK